jgi:hypothetical protein
MVALTLHHRRVMARLHVVTALLFATASLVVGELPAEAQSSHVRRSCKATFVVRAVGVVAAGGFMPFRPAPPDRTPAYEFTGEAGCGTLVRNRCRRRASDIAFTCMAAMASNVNSSSNFGEQCPGYGEQSSSKVDGSFNYRLRQKPFDAYLANYVCAAANQWFDRFEPQRTQDAAIRYEIYGRTWGDTGCGGGDRRSKMTKLATQVITCGRQRNATSDSVLPGTLLFKVFDGHRMPLSHYEHFGNLKEMASAEQCRRACLADEKCKAWSFLPLRDRPTLCNMFDTYAQNEATGSPDYVAGYK